jgi:hypothetical protein
MRNATVGLALSALLLGDAQAAEAQRPGRPQAQQGPAFCRSGQGHPVHGRHWCIDKGFGLGGVVWRQQRWDDVILRSLRRGRSADRATLGDVLGDVVLGRLEGHGRRIRATGALNGRWLSTERGGTLLEVRAGRTPIAELVDINGDGRFDVVLLNTGTR